MKYYKYINAGYIIAVGIGDAGMGEEIPNSEYNQIMAIIRTKPQRTETTDYRLREDLTWEVFEVRPAPEPEQDFTVEDKAEAYDILIGEAE